MTRTNTQVPPLSQTGLDRKVVVIGFDSADPDLILEWAEKGLLPTFAKLRGQSAWGRINNDVANVSGTVWQSFHTGVWPGRHGYYDGTKHFDSETYEDGVDFAARSDAPQEMIWEILSRNQSRVAVIDAPYVFLPDELNGLMLEGWGAHDRHGAGLRGTDFYTVPPELRSQVLATYGEDPLGMLEGACDALKPRNAKELIWLRDALTKRVATKARMTADFLAREPWAYFESNFFGAHCVGHQCWHYHDPEHPRYDPVVMESVDDPFQDVYVALDNGLREVLNATDSDTTVIVYCSHGMGPNYTATGSTLEKILLRLEGIESPERAEGVITKVRNLWRRMPGPLRKRLAHLRARRFEASIQKRIQPPMSERKYFQQHVSGATGGIRINLEGREAHGLVKPGAEYELLIESLRQDLLDLVNDETEEPLITEVIRSSEVYKGPYVERMPDLMVHWNRSRPISRVFSPKVGVITDPNPSVRSGDHAPQGLFFAFGPNVQLGQTDPVAVVDFAPTIAAIIGIGEVDFDGTPIAAFGV